MFSIRKSKQNTAATKMQQQEKNRHHQEDKIIKVVIEDMPPSLCHLMSSGDDGSTISSMSSPSKSDVYFASGKDSSTENSESSRMVMNYFQARNDELKKVNCQLEAEKERLRRQLESLTERGVTNHSQRRSTTTRRTTLANSHETELGVELVKKGKEIRITTKVTRPKTTTTTTKIPVSDERHHSSKRRTSPRARRTKTTTSHHHNKTRSNKIYSKASF